MKQRLFYASLVSLSIVAIGLTGCSQEKGYADLSEKPPEQANAALPTKAQSLITLNALFPYGMISKAFTDALPASTVLNGRQHICVDVTEQVQQSVQRAVGGDVGKFLGQVAKIVTDIVTVQQVRNACLDLDYQANVTRSGPVTFTPLPTGLRLTIPVSVDGSAGFAGDLAKVLKLDKKNFRGAIIATADIDMGINEDWCPVIKAVPDFVWSDRAQLEVMGKFWIDIDSEAGPKIKAAMQDAASKIPGLISCQRVKDLVAPVWHTYEVALPKIMGQTGLVTITPQRVGFSGLNYTPAGVQLALMLTAETQVKLEPAGTGASSLATTQGPANKPEDVTKRPQLPIGRVAAQVPSAVPAGDPPVIALDSKPLELPKLEKIPPQQNSLNLSIPVLASYQSIDQLVASKAVGQVFEGRAAGTTATVKILKTAFYPSGDRLVVGVQFESKITKPKSLAPQGWIYLVAKPQFDVATQTMTLTNVDFSRAIDNDAWNALSFLFQSKIRTAIANAAKLDLRKDITDARAGLRKQLLESAAKEGINLALDDQFVGLTGLALTKDGIQIVLSLKGTSNIIVLNKPA